MKSLLENYHAKISKLNVANRCKQCALPYGMFAPNIHPPIVIVNTVADQILVRIFDQRQFTSGEIDFMVKEFGHDKVNIEENFQRMLKLNQDACVIADTNLADLCDSSETLARNYCDQGM